MITRLSDEYLTKDEIEHYIDQWENSQEYTDLEKYYKYYNTENTAIEDSYQDKKTREKTPNNKIPTAYYKTLPNNLAAYMFQDVVYEPKDGETDIQPLIDVLDANEQDEKDMIAGIKAIAYNRGIEYIYTVGNENNIEIKFSELPTLQVTLIYNTDIEESLFCCIWKRTVSIDADNNERTLIDVIYKDRYQTWQQVKSDTGKDDLTLIEEKPLFFDYVPIAVYRGELIGTKPPMACIIPYQDALDWLITGNANDIQKLTDAILVLTQELEKEEVKHLDEISALMNVSKEDRAEYLLKDTSPEFRKFCVDLLIKEMHKHAHSVDWYDKDLAGNVESARALKMRLYDQDNFSNSVEMKVINGARQRLRAIIKLLAAKKLIDPNVQIQITYNRTLPSDFEAMMDAFKGADWYSLQTKVERTGGNWDLEKTRIEEETQIVIDDTEFDGIDD